jgi:hypothetical protein
MAFRIPGITDTGRVFSTHHTPLKSGARPGKIDRGIANDALDGRRTRHRASTSCRGPDKRGCGCVASSL